MKFRPIKIIAFIACAVLAILLFGYFTMRLWNWLMPVIFGLHTVSFAQALGLLILGKLLFGGFHRHGGGGGRGWRRHMRSRWEQMTPEDRERFQAGMRDRRGCGWPRSEGRPEAPTQIPQ